MTIRAMLGLLLLAGLFVVVGSALVRACIPAISRRGLARLAGLSYLLGVAALGVVWSLLLMIGVPFGVPTMLVSAGAVVACAIVTARHRAVEVGPVSDGDRPDEGLGLTTAISTAVGLAVVAGILEVTFRAGRLHQLTAYDGWAFWVPKAKVIFETGHLDPALFTALPNPNYPPLLPVIDAAGFQAMGSADVVTLHLLHWTHAVAFVFALYAVLASRTRPWILWPFLALGMATPRIASRLLIPEADLFLQYFLVAAIVLVALWIRERQSWQLVCATILLAGASLTKREGIVFIACLLLSAAIASFGRLRYVAPRLGIVAVVVAATALPWRIWYAAHDVRTETPPLAATDLDRAWRSLRLSFSAISEHGWGLAPTVAILSIVVAAIYGSRRLALFQGALLTSFFLAGAYATYGFSELAITLDPANNPILRLTGGIVLAGIALGPLLLASVWEPNAEPLPIASRVRPARVSPLRVAGAVALVLLAYPAVLLAQGGPKFPSRAECARVASSGTGDQVELVFGHLDSPAAAQTLRDDAVRVGFVGTEVSPDGCGLWKVSNDSFDSLTAAEGTAAEARDAGFDPRVEIDVP